MKREIGDQYNTSCFGVFDQEKSLGVVMPIIEPGTRDEGRLFYFGLMPDQRNKGYGSPVHSLALSLLQQKGATYYVGSTGSENKPMLQIFRNNNCTLHREVLSYIRKLSN
ncbi:GNAT family N-acetyltransferase [Pseudalkalibacillus hwajinpoensis]|uniref:GNAT family N-acetyltransferase n=1 Tax=Guptibacillus hwajinpoensis TaxID=208199 RepID=UPI00325B6CB8